MCLPLFVEDSGFGDDDSDSVRFAWIDCEGFSFGSAALVSGFFLIYSAPRVRVAAEGMVCPNVEQQLCV